MPLSFAMIEPPVVVTEMSPELPVFWTTMPCRCLAPVSPMAPLFLTVTAPVPLSSTRMPAQFSTPPVFLMAPWLVIEMFPAPAAARRQA